MDKAKKTLITYLITIAVAAVLMIGVSALRGAFSVVLTQKEAIQCACDAFFVVGMVYLCAGGVMWASRKGTFDGLGYSFSLLKQRYTKNKRNWQNEESFYDYKERKAEKKKEKRSNHLVIIGGIFVIVAAILLVVFYYA